MRLRSFARTWQDLKRERGDDEPVPTGPLVDTVYRIRDRRDQADLERVLGSDPAFRARMARG